MPRLRLDQYLSLALLLGLFILTPGSNTIQLLLPRLQHRVEAEYAPPTLVTTTALPVLVNPDISSDQLAEELSAASIYVMDRDCGCILFQKNSDLARYPASTSKLLTALVARQLYDLDDIVTMSVEAGQSEGTSSHLQPGSQFYIRDILPALLIPSGNDAADMLALHHPDGREGFVKAMNKRAAELHLSSSQFDNPSGLDSPRQYVSARDMAILAHEAMKDDVLRLLVGMPSFTIFDLADNAYPLNNTHGLLGVIPGVVGIKTGTTDNAGENLITEIDRSGHKIILVVLGSRDRYGETRRLIDWIFESYVWKNIETPQS